MRTPLSLAEQRKSVSLAMADRMEISLTLAEEICRRLPNELVRHIVEELGPLGQGTVQVKVKAKAEDLTEPDSEDVVIDMPEFWNEPGEINDVVKDGDWVRVTITDPIDARNGKISVRGMCWWKQTVASQGGEVQEVQAEQTYRFWDEFNSNLNVAKSRFAKLRQAAGINPASPIKRRELVGKEVMARYEQRDSGRFMVDDYRPSDYCLPTDQTNG